MKFSEIMQNDWEELKPYLDTCLLPITGLSGLEQPWEAGDRLEALRDAMDLIEIPYRGRIVTMPAVQYMPGQAYAALLEDLCVNLRASGFRHIIAITAAAEASGMLPAAADLQLYVDPESLAAAFEDVKASIDAQIQALWSRG
jgi:hypothetical protein